MAAASDQRITSEIGQTVEAIYRCNSKLILEPYRWRLTHEGQECLREKDRLLATLKEMRTSEQLEATAR